MRSLKVEHRGPEVKERDQCAHQLPDLLIDHADVRQIAGPWKVSLLTRRVGQMDDRVVIDLDHMLA